MNKFYITYDKKRNFYSYALKDGKIVYLKLSEQETHILLQGLAKSIIIDVIEKNEKAIEVTYDNGFKIVIDDLRVFKQVDDKYDKFMNNLRMYITTFIEQKQIATYQKSLPKGYKPRVNRSKNKSRSRKFIVATVGFAMGLVLASNLYKEINKEIKLEPENNPKEITFSITYDDFIKNSLKNHGFIKEKVFGEFEIEEPLIAETLAVKEPEIINEEILLENVPIEISLEYKDRTNTGKLQKTIDFCGSSIKYYSERYGLPYKVMCAQMTQERPNEINGINDNICQITYDLFIGKVMHVPVYDENGFTGEYDDFKVTKEMLDTTEGNIMVGMAYNRYCVDKYNSLFTGVFSYNQGENSLANACKYYGLDVNNYLGDENSIAARDLINRYYEEGLGKKHGDSKYLERVFSYMPMEERGSETIEYYLGNKLITVDLTNTNVYNSELSR